MFRPDVANARGNLVDRIIDDRIGHGDADHLVDDIDRLILARIAEHQADRDEQAWQEYMGDDL
jgi:hypothetical protein